jgi:hypothetical protein
MPLHDLERRRIENSLSAFIKKIRPAPHIRPELDFDFNISGQSVELVEVRPQWDDKTVVHRRPFAKATFVRTQGVWKIYWLRQTLKWHSYEPNPEVTSIEQFLFVVEADRHACFFG